MKFILDLIDAIFGSLIRDLFKKSEVKDVRYTQSEVVETLPTSDDDLLDRYAGLMQDRSS